MRRAIIKATATGIAAWHTGSGCDRLRSSYQYLDFYCGQASAKLIIKELTRDDLFGRIRMKHYAFNEPYFYTHFFPYHFVKKRYAPNFVEV